jgi:hypothetical protein
MSRIGPVTVGPLKDVDSYGALVEMEAENAIKYRTCSWQKVWLNPLLLCAVLQPPSNSETRALVEHFRRESLAQNPLSIELTEAFGHDRTNKLTE